MTQHNPTHMAIILAGGIGSRMQSHRPKQFMSIGGQTAGQTEGKKDSQSILARSIMAFATHPRITHIQIVSHPHWTDDTQAVIDGLDIPITVLPIINGGDTRQQSVYNALHALQTLTPALNPDYVYIHDGARPFVSHQVIDNVMDGLQNGHTGVIPATPATDTLKTTDGTVVMDTLNRDSIVHAQTPQGFAYPPIWNAHQMCLGQSLTDDASVLATAGHTVHWVQGCPSNIKITTPNDLQKDTSMQQNPSIAPRIGNGYDVHRFTQGDHIMLCGVKIPHSQGFLAHSDGDVAMHALTDAIYGALGDGDIGQHFPPSDKKWQGADSTIFLKHAVDLVRDRGGHIGNIDITIICEHPKIAPHTQTMRDRLADIMDIDVSQISIKATTSEKLGFTGREEGIASMANAIIII